jgi:hypothetical protein
MERLTGWRQNGADCSTLAAWAEEHTDDLAAVAEKKASAV